MDNKLSAIVEGWTNVIFPNTEVEKLALERAKICATCESNKFNMCSECGCVLIAKTRSTKSTNNCPLNKWNEININKS